MTSVITLVSRENGWSWNFLYLEVHWVIEGNIGCQILGGGGGGAGAPPAPTPLLVQGWRREFRAHLPYYVRGGGSNARLGGRELTLLCGFNQYTLLQNRDNSGLLGTPYCCRIEAIVDCWAPLCYSLLPLPMIKLGRGPLPPPPLWSPPETYRNETYHLSMCQRLHLDGLEVDLLQRQSAR